MQPTEKPLKNCYIICWLSTYGNVCKCDRPLFRFFGWGLHAWGRGCSACTSGFITNS